MLNTTISISLIVLCCGCIFAQQEQQTVKTVESVDLARYAGLWYEIAKMPNRFQKKCVSNTTAEYKLLENGYVQVTNRCQQANGNIDSIKGMARIVDRKTNAKLQVSFVRFFGINWFWGDYWIIGLDNNYHWAVVGHPDRLYGWILCRTPEMAESDRQSCYQILRDQDYDPQTFVATKH